MAIFAHYTPEGRILLVGPTASIEGLDSTVLSVAVPVNTRPQSHYIDVVTQATVQIPPQPTPRHTWDWTTKAWVLPATIRSDVKALVTEEAVRRNSMPFNYAGHYYRCDAQGQAAIMQSAIRYPITPPSGWTWPDINGVPVAMTAVDWQLFWAAVADRPLGIQVVVEFLHSFIDDTGHSESLVASVNPALDSSWPETARP